VPQGRDGSCSPTLFARYQRSEQALLLALMEMVRNGVATRKVAAVPEELCGTHFSRSTVRHVCRAWEARGPAWHERPIGAQAYPFVVVAAVGGKGRHDEAMRAMRACGRGQRAREARGAWALLGGQ
jgi:putative transposase